MANFRSVKTIFWSDSKIIEDFTPEDRYFYLYLLTNEKSNQLGCYELSIKHMCRDTGYNEETIKKLLERFENEHKVIFYDYETKEIFLKNWHKYNWLNSDKTKKCIEKEFLAVKSRKLQDFISPLYAPYITHGSNKEKEKEKENKKNKEKREREEAILEISTTTAPTLNDIISFFEELGYKKNDVFCEGFKDYYDEKGWMKNWKSRFKKWCSEDEAEKKISKRELKEYMYFDDEGNLIKEMRDEK